MIRGLGDYSNLKGGAKALSRALRRNELVHEENYASFIAILYEDLDEISYRFNKNPQARMSDSENRLNIEIADTLSLLGYTTNHDSMSGGHVDITVEIGEHSWIGEAKIYRDNTSLYEGFLQLTTRYRPASGNWKHNHGGLLIYIQAQNSIRDLLTDWRRFLMDSLYKEGISIEFKDCENNCFAYFSVHNHEVTGKDFIVRHIPFILTHAPSDKSARNRKGRKK